MRKNKKSILETIVADMPDMFYSEILPKLGLFETLNLAKVSKKYRDLVWSLEGARSFPAKVEAHFAKVNVLAGTSPASFDAPLFENMTPLFWAARHGNLRAVKALGPRRSYLGYLRNLSFAHCHSGASGNRESTLTSRR